MSQNRFNQYTSQGDANVTDGSLDIFGYSLRAGNLNPGQALKTNSINQLISTKLEINDINNLQTELNATIQTPYGEGDIVITNGNIVSQDVVTDTITSLNNTITNIENSVTDKVSKSGDTMSGNLNMDSNSILNVNEIKVDSIDSKGGMLSVSFPSNLNSQDIICDNVREKTLLGGVRIQNHLHMNNKNIDDIATLTSSTLISTALQTSIIQNQAPETPIDIASSLNLLSVSINGGSNISTTSIDCDTINPLSGVNITLNGDLNMNTNGISNVNGIDTNTILTDTIGEKTIGSGVSLLDSALTITNINFPTMTSPLLSINSNYIANPSTIKIKTDIHEGYTLQTYNQMITASSTNILIQSDDDEIKLSTGGGVKSLIIDNSLSSVKIQDYKLNMNGNIIENVEEIKTNNLTSSTDTKILINNDLDFQNTKNLINCPSINGIRPSGGVFSESSNFSLSGVQAEQDVLNTGVSYGSLSIPANGFQPGDAYALKVGGTITCDNNDVFTLRLRANFGGLSPIFSTFVIAVEGAQTNGWWELEAEFIVRSIGAATVASMSTNGSYTYFNTTNVSKGYGVNTIESTVFDTTVSNELNLTYETAEVSITSFAISQVMLTKLF